MTKKSRKRGISPVVATVLLISLVIVIALIVFLWLWNFTEEAVTKFDGKNVKIVCDDIRFSADYNAGKLKLSNSGNVPIYSMKLKEYTSGGYSTEDINEMDVNWKATGLNPGTSFGADFTNKFYGKTKVLIIPILMGISQSGETKTYVCEDRHGIELFLS